MRRALAFLLLVAAFAVASWLGWWAVPLVAALWGWLRPAVWRPIWSAVLAAGLGWAGWLLADALSDSGAFTRLGQRLGAVMALPFPVLLLLTVLFPALLAWSAGALACGLSQVVARHRDAG